MFVEPMASLVVNAIQVSYIRTRHLTRRTDCQ